MDVGAGNGILSLFSLQMGAKHVYAVEASGVVEGLRKLVRRLSRAVPMRPMPGSGTAYRWCMHGWRMCRTICCGSQPSKLARIPSSWMTRHVWIRLCPSAWVWYVMDLPLGCADRAAARA